MKKILLTGVVGLMVTTRIIAHEPTVAEYQTEAVSPINQEDKAVYQSIGGMGCAVCHGEYGDGGESVGNNIRHTSLARLKHAFETVPVMQGLARAMNDERYQAVDNYLNQLSERQLIKVTVTENEIIHQATETLMKEVYGQLVIHNGGSNMARVHINGQLEMIAPRANFAMDIAPGQAAIKLTLAAQNLVIERE